MISSASVSFFVLTELTLPFFILLSLLRRRVCVLDYQPFLVSIDLLQRIVDWSVRRGAGCDIRDLLPATARFWIINSPNSGSGSFFDYFAPTEDAMERHYDYGRLDTGVPEYAAPIKSAIGNYYDNHVYQIYMLRDVEASGLALSVWGLNADIRAYYAAYWGHPVRLRVRMGWSLNRAISLVLGVVAMASIVLHALRRLRLTPPVAPRTFFAVDMPEGNARTIRLVENIACDDFQPLYVARTPAILAQARSVLGPRPCCARQDGLLPVSWLAWALKVAILHVIRLWLAAGHLHPRIVREIYGFAFWRLEYRMFLRRHPIRYFLGRDDYTPEHHIRSQELRRAGGVSLGIRHGLSWTGIHGGFRYLDFDHYYVFGEEHGEVAFFRQKYPPHMQVHVVGSWGMTREELRSAPKDEDRPRDILVGTSNSPGGLVTAQGVHAVAAAFPERKVYFRPKGRRYPKMPDLESAITYSIENPSPNMILDDKKSYDIFHKVSYYIGNVSSFVAEAIQHGVISFCIDAGFDETYEPRPFSYRHYPFILVRDMDEAIARIRAIEAGDWRYPREQAATLIDLSGQIIFDAIRADMGLPPKDAISG